MAIKQRKSHLFKYRPIDLNTLEMIRDDFVYFNSPNNFNDPFDCKMIIEYKGDDDEWNEYFKKKGQELSNDQKLLMKHHLINDVEKNTYNFQKNILSNFWVLSLSGKCDDILLWSHYAKNHSGLCIQYTTVEIYDDKSAAHFLEFQKGAADYQSQLSNLPNNFIMAHPVTYKTKMPRPYNVLKENLNDLTAFVTTKHENWSYEKEFRIFLPIEQVLQQKAKINYQIVSGFIFGIKTNKRDVINVKTFFDSKLNKPEISISKMDLYFDNYGLKRVFYDSFDDLIKTLDD